MNLADKQVGMATLNAATWQRPAHALYALPNCACTRVLAA